MNNLYRNTLICVACCLFFCQSLFSQAGDCPYPIIFLHGWTGNDEAWQPLYANIDFQNIWGAESDVFNAVANATINTNIYGADGIANNADDDVLTLFNNENNTLQPGCIYAMNLENFWNQNPSNPMIDPNGDWGLFSDESDSNESAIKKGGLVIKKMIQKVLAANPGKKKVILVGHSMGGLDAREYLQRKTGSTPTWWVTPAQAEGHKVAKLFTVGTPHRGSNTLGNLFQNGEANERNSTPDLFSEAVRDLRYSYSCGFLNLYNCPGIYLFGGNENDLGSFYRNNDVDCDGDENSTSVTGVNQSGKTQFGPTHNEWEGTNDNPSIPLPTNVKYTYYVSNLFSAGCDPAYASYGCGGDGVVDDERQWLYTNGDGKTNSSFNGNSLPAPSDGTAYRASDRITSPNRISHLGQVSDTDQLMRGLDEPDFPYYAYEVNQNIWYAGLAQKRADKVALKSELTNQGNNLIDCDWYKVYIGSSRSLQLQVIPQPNMKVRVDLYQEKPSLYGNAASTIHKIYNPGASTLITLNSNASSLAAGYYYFRITHYVSTAPNQLTGWKTPYKFKIAATTQALEGQTTENLAVMNVYPNPTHSNLTIELESVENAPVQWEIFNQLGQSLLKGKAPLESGENELDLDVTNIQAGVYIAILQQGDTRKVVKFSKW